MLKRQKIYCVVCVAVFLLLFLWCFHKSTYILRYKAHANDTVGSFYNEKSDSIDVVFVGSSHAYRGFSPMEAWNRQGFTSYTLATQEQSIPVSYYLMKEAIRTQHPKVIVLEVYGAKFKADYTTTPRVHAAIDGIPINRTKLEIFGKLLPRSMNMSEILEFVFPIIYYHDRWDSLEEKDFHPLNSCLRGFLVSYKTQAQEEPGEVPTEEEKIYEGAMEYLEKIVSLCRENNVELLLCQTPSGDYSSYGIVRRKVNTVKKRAQELGVPFVDFEQLRDELHLDYATDFRDHTHLSMYGAEKVTNYISDYLTEHYELVDHRGDGEYADWEQDYQDYLRLKEEKRLSSSTEVELADE